MEKKSVRAFFCPALDIISKSTCTRRAGRLNTGPVEYEGSSITAIPDIMWRTDEIRLITSNESWLSPFPWTSPGAPNVSVGMSPKQCDIREATISVG